MKNVLLILAKEKGFRSGIIGESVNAIHTTKDYYYLWMCELQKWLRDIHNIDVKPYLILCKHNDKEIPQQPEEKEYDYKLIVSGISQYIGTIQNNLSYEEALEIGLQEALKLI